MDLEFDIQLEPGAKAPEKTRDSDIGWDLFCYEPVQFTYSGEYIKVYKQREVYKKKCWRQYDF